MNAPMPSLLMALNSFIRSLPGDVSPSLFGTAPENVVVPEFWRGAGASWDGET